MEKYVYDKNNSLWYELNGEYYIPCLVLPAEKGNKPIGLWVQQHLQYLKEYRRVITYFNLLTSGKLSNYLADIDKQAKEHFERLTEDMKQQNS